MAQLCPSLFKIKSWRSFRKQLRLSAKFSSLSQYLDKLPGRKEMKVVKVIGDGNCQFRSVGLLLSGMDCEINHRRLRALAVEEFKTFDDSELKRTVFFTHHATDCLKCVRKLIHTTEQ